MLHGAGARTRIALALAIALGLLLASCSSEPLGQTPGAANLVTAPAKFLGPLMSSQETATQSIGRDGGMTVPLPNGKVLWIFGDTPTYTFNDPRAPGEWLLTSFEQGSSAGIGKYTPGQAPTAPLNELQLGQKPTKATKAAQFLPPPDVYLPDGSGKVCNKENGGSSAGAVRWASGGILMPDKTNVFIPYIDACVINATVHQAEGWGFAMYNWKTNQFSTPPTDVFVPKKSGEAIPTSQFFGSPILDGSKITMFSSTCCDVGSSVYATTVDATLEALKNPASYVPSPILGLPATWMLSVSKASPTQPELTMYELTGVTGEYRLLTATNAAGPWTERADGKLPQCDTSPKPCNNSIYLHPEFSSADAAERVVLAARIRRCGPDPP